MTRNPVSADAKTDLFKEHKSEYAAKATPQIVDVGRGRYIAVDGQGAPGGDEFQGAVAALYPMAYTMKFACKAEGRDFVVCKLEGQWWNTSGPRAQWKWRMMIRVPDFVDEATLRAARDAAQAKGTDVDVGSVKLIELEEGPCVQALHVGPYDREQATLDAMAELARAEGRKPHGRHHEIYLSDPRRVEPAKLKTILRQPVK